MVGFPHKSHFYRNLWFGVSNFVYVYVYIGNVFYSLNGHSMDIK